MSTHTVSAATIALIGPGGRDDVLRVPVLPDPHPREVRAAAHPDGASGMAAVQRMLTVEGARHLVTRTRTSVSVVDDEGYAIRYMSDDEDAAPSLEEVADALGEAGVAVVERSAADLVLAAIEGPVGDDDPPEIWVDLVDWDGESPAPRGLLALARVVVVSDHAIEDPLGVASDLLDDGRTCVLVTHGRAGATAFLADSVPLYLPVTGPEGHQVSPNSPAARGLVREAFIAGLLAARHRGDDWIPGLRAAAEVAGSES